MKFWDASAVVPLLVAEGPTPAMRAIRKKDAAMAVWWGTEIECASALSRLERNGKLTAAATADAFGGLETLSESWNEIQLFDGVRRIARRIVRVHDLRAADALQLGAALVASENQPASLEFVSLDRRLIDAALREGLRVVEVPAP